MASSLNIERIGAKREKAARPAEDPRPWSPAADRPGGLRRRQPRVLPAVRPARDAQLVHCPPRRDGHGRGGGEPARSSGPGRSPRRGAGDRGFAAAGPLLELLAGESLVGDHRLRLTSEQPERAPGDSGRRRRSCAPSSPTRTPASPTGWTPRGTASDRSFCAASAPRRARPDDAGDPFSDVDQSVPATPAGTPESGGPPGLPAGWP